MVQRRFCLVLSEYVIIVAFALYRRFIQATEQKLKLFLFNSSCFSLSHEVGTMRRDKIVHLSGKAEIIGSNAIKGTKQANRDLCCLECRNDLDIVHLNDSGIVHHESISMTTQMGKTFTLTTVIKSANWHVTMNCNYSCRFCFYKNMTGEFKDIKKARHILETLKAKKLKRSTLLAANPCYTKIWTTF